MKRIHEIVKPFLSIIFGALLLLLYLNNLSGQGTGLAKGIVGVILAAYYIGIGIVVIILGDKLGKIRAGFDCASIALFPAFFFVIELLGVINVATNYQPEFFGPTGWTIAIISMTASLALAIVVLIDFFAGSKAIRRITQLFGAIFVLTLVLDIAFVSVSNFNVMGMQIGDPSVLGGIEIVVLVMYASFVSMLLSYVAGEPRSAEAPKAQEEAPEAEENQPTEAQAEEEVPQVEEKPTEETPTEEPKEE